MAAELCIPYPIAMVDVFAGRINRYASHDYGELPAIKAAVANPVKSLRNE